VDRSHIIKGFLIGAVLISVIFFIHQKGFGENWKRFTKIDLDDSFFAYDQDSIAQVSPTTRLVWEKKISPLEDKFKARTKTGLSIKMRLWEMNCKKRTAKLITIKEFDKDDRLLSSINTDESVKSDFISPGSMGESLYKAVCPKIKK
jgi:hypothetical protein